MKLLVKPMTWKFGRNERVPASGAWPECDAPSGMHISSSASKWVPQQYRLTAEQQACVEKNARKEELKVSQRPVRRQAEQERGKSQIEVKTEARR
eukprot:6211811-Pleurochrysis_carterae.AAC.2